MSHENNALIRLQQQADVTLLPDNDRYKNRFEIKSETSTRIYTISQVKKDNSWACSCPGWIRFRKCKHLQSLEPLLRSLNENTQYQNLLA
jgi:hypothetical protein